MVEAYVLVQTAVGRATAVAEALTGLDGVLLAESVTGPYDVVARLQVASIDELGTLIAVDIPALPDISRTVTCTVVPT